MPNYPKGPFIELNFYYHLVPEHVAFSNLLNHLVNNGGRLSNEGTAHKGKNIVSQKYASTSELEIHLFDPIQTDWQSFPNNDIRIISVGVFNATGIDKTMIEQVTMTNISPTAISKCNHPVAIWTDGETIDIANSERYLGENPKQVQKGIRQGKKIYKRFLEIVSATSPVYAAITTEWGMECPYDLVHVKESRAFNNFYVDVQVVGKERLAQIQEIYPDAYIEEIHNGVYVSGEWAFNPKQRDLDEIGEPLWLRSSKVAKIIGSAFLK